MADTGSDKLGNEPPPEEKKGVWYYVSPKKILIRWARLSIRRPFLCAGLATGLLLIITMATIGSGKFVFNTPTDKDWNVDDAVSRRVDAIDEAEALLGSLKEVKAREISAEKAQWMFVYRTTDGANVFTPENVAVMREVEAMVTGNANWGECCQLVYDYTGGSAPAVCKLPTTPLNYFYPSAPGVYDGQGTVQADVTSTLSFLAGDMYENGFYFSDGFGPDNLNSDYTRSFYPFGGPLPNYSSVTDDESEQLIKYRDMCQTKMTDDLQDYFGMSAPFLSSAYRSSSVKGNLEVMWVSTAIMDAEFEATAMGDFMWAFFSIISVWAYMSFHTSSLMLAGVGMFEICISFPVAFFLYRLIFQVSYFATVHLLIIFVVLGIGADDVFVFVDAYKQSRLDPVYGDSIDHRLYYTVKRASKAIFMTSATTCFAFLATAISDIMPISSFGIWAGLVIIVLFLVNCFVLPPYLVIWARYFEKYACCCCCPCLCGPCRKPAKDFTDTEAANGTNGKVPGVDFPEKASEMRRDTEEWEHEGEIPVDSMRRMEKFFNGPWSTLMSKGKYFVVGGFLVLLVLGAVLALGLEPPTEEERWFPTDHMFQKWLSTLSNNPFTASAEDEVVEVHMMWGIEDMSTSGKNRWNPVDRGEIVWDPTFEAMTWGQKEQEFLASVCGKARAKECQAAGCYEGYGKMLVRANEGLCFTEGFQAFLGPSRPLGSLTHDEFLDSLWDFSRIPGTEFDYPLQIGFVPDPANPPDLGGRPPLKFVQFVFNSTYSSVLTRQPKTVIVAWDDYANELNMDAEATEVSAGLQGAFTAGGRDWAWEQTKQKLVSNAVQGMSICFVMALVVLNISTGNWILSIYATVTILGIVASVLGIGVAGMVQWDFGISESISSVILIGFSVDYCVHLAGAYVESHRHTRFERMQDSLTHMGISVSAGCVSTLLSGMILWACTLTFFTKFAFLIVSTIAFSYIWSIGFFAAMCFWLGPEEGAGDWAPLIKKCMGKGKKEEGA